MSYLDEIYGMDSEMDQLAEAEFLTKVAADAGIDVDELDDDEIAYLYVKVAEAAQDAAMAEDEDEEEQVAEALAQAIAAEQAKESGYYGYDEDFEEKIAEADYMGRVMAHSYADELEKIAGPRMDKAYKWVRNASGRASSAIGDVLERLGAGTRGVFGGQKAIDRQLQRLDDKALNKTVARVKKELASRGQSIGGGMTDRLVHDLSKEVHPKVVKEVTRRANIGRGAALGGGVLGLAGLTGAGGYALNKKSAAEENYIVGRAIEKLAERGYDVDDLFM